MDVVLAARTMAITFAIISFVCLCVFTFFNVTVMRARIFVIEKANARKKQSRRIQPTVIPVRFQHRENDGVMTKNGRTKTEDDDVALEIFD